MKIFNPDTKFSQSISVKVYSHLPSDCSAALDTPEKEILTSVPPSSPESMIPSNLSEIDI